VNEADLGWFYLCVCMCLIHLGGSIRVCKTGKMSVFESSEHGSVID